MNYNVIRYSQKYKTQWDDFVRHAKNATFLFYRDFMEYHSDRFEDFSLMVFKKNKLWALLPANKDGQTLLSHQGLSYGGIIKSKDSNLNDLISIYYEILYFLKFKNFKTLSVKSLPIIYHDKINQEEVLIHNLLDATILRVDSYLVIDNSLDKEIEINRNRKRALKKAQDFQLNFKKSDDLKEFWEKILTPNLRNRFNTNPTHTFEEIKKLKDFFPSQIQFYGVYEDEILRAGAVMFITNNVAHFQYSSGDENRDNGALDLLFYSIVELFKDKKYISFGNSSEDNGRKINQGLLFWKESFDAESIVQTFYDINVNNFDKLKHCFS